MCYKAPEINDSLIELIRRAICNNYDCSEITSCSSCVVDSDSSEPLFVEWLLTTLRENT